MDITITCRDGARIVDAVLCARYFGIHQDVEGSGHTVTHIPSGLAIRDGMTFAQAIQIARRFARLPLDWSETERAPFEAWARRHPWQIAWALGVLARPLQRAWARAKGRFLSRLAPYATKVKGPIADLLNRREDTCWCDLVSWQLHRSTLIDATPWGFWGPQVARCRRDARVNGSCYCGKFCNQPTALDLGWKPGDKAPIVVGSELTRLDDERTISFSDERA